MTERIELADGIDVVNKQTRQAVRWCSEESESFCRGNHMPHMSSSRSIRIEPAIWTMVKEDRANATSSRSAFAYGC